MRILRAEDGDAALGDVLMIEAGAAFRALRDRHGAVEITEVRRQREDWQREATRELATGRTADALDRYEVAGMVREHQTHEAAREAVVEGWQAQREADPGRSQVILAHTRADVAELNRLARERVRDAGELGEDVAVETGRGERAFASGDRVMFLRNERSMGVKNGTLGTVEEIEPGRMAVRLDGAERRRVSFDLKDYADLDHGYASTIHKAQGVTVDRAHVLATPGLDRHAAYVALTRHRDGVELHYGADQFRDPGSSPGQALARTLGRERAKDTTLDYTRTFAERRGIEVPLELQREAARHVARERAPGRKPGMFDGLKLGTPTAPRRDRFAGLKLDASPLKDRGAEIAAGGAPLDRAMRDYTSAYADIERMYERGQKALPDQDRELKRAGKALGEADRNVASDLRQELTRNPGLAMAAETPGGAGKLARAIAHEAKVRASPELRADRFVEEWRGLSAQRTQLARSGDRAGADLVGGHMGELAGNLHRDAQLESVLRSRRKELGLGMGGAGGDIGRELTRKLDLGLTLGRGLGL